MKLLNIIFRIYSLFAVKKYNKLPRNKPVCLFKKACSVGGEVQLSGVTKSIHKVCCSNFNFQRNRQIWLMLFTSLLPNSRQL
jgi:hypothetical protein